MATAATAADDDARRKCLGAEEAGEEASDAAVKDSFRANLASILMGSGPARPAPQPAPQDLEEEEEACEADGEGSRGARSARSTSPVSCHSPAFQTASVFVLASAIVNASRPSSMEITMEVAPSLGMSFDTA